jgi:hypothetical protein
LLKIQDASSSRAREYVSVRVLTWSAACVNVNLGAETRKFQTLPSSIFTVRFYFAWVYVARPQIAVGGDSKQL